MIFLQGENDEGIKPMQMTVIGAWNGVEVQQGCPSPKGGTRLIWFECPMWRPKEIQVRAQFGDQEQHTLKKTARSHTKSVLHVLYMVGTAIS
jgi:hypothetical protein